MIEENNSLGANVPLSSSEMALIFLRIASLIWKAFRAANLVWLCRFSNVLAGPSVVKIITLSSLKQA